MQLTQHEARRRISSAFETPRFSIGAALHQMYTGGLRSGPEADISAELAESCGHQYDANRAYVPWSVLGVQTRDMTAAGVSGSNYLIGVDQMPTATVLNGASLAQESGAVIKMGLQGNVAMPRISARPAAYWLSGENTVITETQPTVGVTSATPKAVACLVEGSKLMRVQSTEVVDVVLQREFTAAAWLAFDTAIVSGSGVNGQPLGLASMLTPVSGTSLSWATINASMREAVTTAGGRNLSAWAGPATETALRGRERFSGAGPIWADATGLGMRTTATPAVADAGLVIGDFSTMTVLIWGYPKLHLNPYGDFGAGRWQARLIVECDFLIPHAGAFSIATSIT